MYFFNLVTFCKIFIVTTFLLLNCHNKEVIDRPFDINIIEMRADLEKQNKYLIDEDDKLCCQLVLDYFKGGYDLTIRIYVHSDINEEISLVLNYFNHITTPESSFVSINNGDIIYTCINKYAKDAYLCDWAYHRVLEEGVHNLIMRVNFGDCEINDGYLIIRFPFVAESFGNNTRYKYIDKWATNSLFFPVIKGQVSKEPLYIYPSELADRIWKFMKKEKVY